MAEKVTLAIGRKYVTDMLARERGTKSAVQFFLNRAHSASQRAKTDITTNNTTSLAANTQIMIDNIEMIRLIIGDEEKPL